MGWWYTHWSYSSPFHHSPSSTCTWRPNLWSSSASEAVKKRLCAKVGGEIQSKTSWISREVEERATSWIFSGYFMFESMNFVSYYLYRPQQVRFQSNKNVLCFFLLSGIFPHPTKRSCGSFLPQRRCKRTRYRRDHLPTHPWRRIETHRGRLHS